MRGATMKVFFVPQIRDTLWELPAARVSHTGNQIQDSSLFNTFARFVPISHFLGKSEKMDHFIAHHVFIAFLVGRRGSTAPILMIFFASCELPL